MKKIAIMQPYLLPYIGYFQLLQYVDTFVVYDDVQFTKKGWVNRNNLQGGNGRWTFSLPIEAGPVDQTISQKTIAREYDPAKIVSRISQEYRKFLHKDKRSSNFIHGIFGSGERNLFHFLRESLVLTSRHLNINPEKILTSSEIGDFRNFKGQEKVIAICQALQANVYINPIGGVNLYKPEAFSNSGINLQFLESMGSRSVMDSQVEPPFSILHEIITLEESELLERITNSFSIVKVEL